MTHEPSTEVALAGMRFHVCVGILPHEREYAQPLEVDLIVRHDAGRSVLDYRDLYMATRSVVESDPLTYLEAFAEAVATRMFAFDGVDWCRVVVRKPHVSLGGPLLYAQIAIERSRG
ncbi:MAG: dihydroneopterin aldolase [bacterium]